MIEAAGFADVRIGGRVDTFGGAEGENKARTYEVYGYSFLATKPGVARQYGVRREETEHEDPVLDADRGQ
jgi:hypothetical protein